MRDRPYVLRITNPLPCRVGVALAVDGLNTIDARYGDATSAAKWVLPPYGSLEVPGWQVNGLDARRFFFTGERSSYGAWLGKTENLGVIEAVFYREKTRPIRVAPQPVERRVQGGARDSSARSAAGGSTDGGCGASRSRRWSGRRRRGRRPTGKRSSERVEALNAPPVEQKVSEEYAATGIGERTNHRVEWVDLDLEDGPRPWCASYEFREQLVQLGVLREAPDPLTRRQPARGFSGGYCPEPSSR